MKLSGADESRGAVKKFRPGVLVGVDAWWTRTGRVRTEGGDEQYCLNFPTLTYNAEDKISAAVTYGGYSDSIVVDEAFVLARLGRN